MKNVATSISVLSELEMQSVSGGEDHNFAKDLGYVVGSAQAYVTNILEEVYNDISGLFN